MLGRRLASPHARRQGFASRAAASPRSVVRLAAHAQMYRRLRDSLSVAGRSILLALLLEAKLVDPTDHGTARGSALHCAFTISLRLALESLSCHLTPWLDISIAFARLILGGGRILSGRHRGQSNIAAKPSGAAASAPVDAAAPTAADPGGAATALHVGSARPHTADGDRP